MKATVVIGASFGDEGKGLITDYLCAPHGAKSIVVRFNGGAQAAHTVVTNTRRHVFSHFGSGSLTGAATYLSRYFIVNPLLWQKELSRLGFVAHCVIDPTAILTTPYDMLINQEAENQRSKKHGSCGIGINETVERCEGRYRTVAADLLHAERLREQLLAIRDKYVSVRIEQLGIVPTEEFTDRLASESLLNSFLNAASQLVHQCRFADEDYLQSWGHIVFEGAQGLLLDQSHSFFPHVTRSNTGLKNAREIARRQEIDLKVLYLTRTYLTRHGEGPFPTENKELRYVDETNHPNEWQGSLRYGSLDVDLVTAAIRGDKDDRIHASLVTTHADQAPTCCADKLAEQAGLGIAMRSYGPMREQVKET